MELIEKKVYRLDVNDYYSTIEYLGKIALFGFSRYADTLLAETLDYARRYKCGDAIVCVYCRSSLGNKPEVVSKVSL